MLHQVQRAADPQISLASVLSDWNEIRQELAENPRRRGLQLESIPLG